MLPTAVAKVAFSPTVEVLGFDPVTAVNVAQVHVEHDAEPLSCAVWSTMLNALMVVGTETLRAKLTHPTERLSSTFELPAAVNWAEMMQGGWGVETGCEDWPRAPSRPK